MRQAEQDGEHIWLRQSVTFTTNGQTRTVEMGIPLRPGAPAEEIERLLDEAESNMRRVSQRLDSHVAALLNGNMPAAPSETAPHAAPATPATHAAPATPASTSASMPSTLAAPTPTPSTPTPASPPAPTASPRPAPRPERPTPAPAPMPAPARADAPAPSRPAPTPPAPPAPPARSRPSGPLAGPAPSPAAPAAGGELTRKDFLAATTDMGLTVKHVMERLGVRTLEGLNLYEALESLRRQMLRDGVPASAPAPAAPAATATSATSNGAAPAPTSPRYFEEEDDDYDVTFTLDGDDALAEELDAYPPAGTLDDREDPDALDDLDLDDVPDFGPPPSAARASHAAHPPARRPASATASATPPPSSAAAPAAESAPEPEPALSPTDQRIAQLRAVHGGGAPTTHQRTAYRNVVVSELGDEAAALVRGLWRVNPERLGPEQLDALISWGKQDTFAEEAADALATLRAERQQAQQAVRDESSTPAAPRSPQQRSRTQQPPRAPSGGR